MHFTIFNTSKSYVYTRVFWSLNHRSKKCQKPLIERHFSSNFWDYVQWRFYCLYIVGVCTRETWQFSGILRNTCRSSSCRRHTDIEREEEGETNASPCSIWKTEGGRRRLCSKVYRNRICLRAYRIHSKKVTQAIRAARASFDTPPMVAVPARSARVKVVVLTCLRASRIRFHRAWAL